MRRAAAIGLSLLVFWSVHSLKGKFRASHPAAEPETRAASAPEPVALRAPASAPLDMPMADNKLIAAAPGWEQFLELLELVRTLKASPARFENHLKRAPEYYEEFKREWLGKHQGFPNGSPEEIAELIRLCRGNVLFACVQYRSIQNERLYEVYERSRQMAEADERDLAEARREFFRGQLDELDDYLCRNGLSPVCFNPLQDGRRAELEATVISYCLDGNPEYCGEAGEALQARYERGLREGLAEDEMNALKDQAQGMMARACDGDEFWRCYDLLQEPLKDLEDSRSKRALERLEGLCDQGQDGSACVAIASVLSDGDRSQIADAVRGYCDQRALRREAPVQGEQSVCERLANSDSIDDSLWKDLTGLSYEGNSLGGSVLIRFHPLERIDPERQPASESSSSGQDEAGH